MKIRPVKHPFEYVLNKYIRKLGITQKQLQQELGIGAKTLSELYNYKRGITPLTALKLGKYFKIEPELLMRMQVEYELAQTYDRHQQEIEHISAVEKRLAQKDPTVDRKPGGALLLAELNNSLSDRSRHYTLHELQQLFFTKRFSRRKRYAVKLLFTEASLQTILNFLKERMIPLERLQALYQAYLEQLQGKPNQYVEWLFKDLHSTN